MESLASGLPRFPTTLCLDVASVSFLLLFPFVPHGPKVAAPAPIAPRTELTTEERVLELLRQVGIEPYRVDADLQAVASDKLGEHDCSTLWRLTRGYRVRLDEPR
jgi:hypothetical protein